SRSLRTRRRRRQEGARSHAHRRTPPVRGSARSPPGRGFRCERPARPSAPAQYPAPVKTLQTDRFRRYAGLMDGTAREQRAVENEAAFRAANDSLHQVFTETDDGETDLYPFLCECADRGCTAIIEIPLERYEQVREHPARFLIVPGHKEPSEAIIDEDDTWQVIEKTGAAGMTARALWSASLAADAPWKRPSPAAS